MNDPLSPQVFQILLALSGAELHGYGIIQEVERQSNGQMRLGAGTLYGSIKRMLTAGWIVESGERPDPALDNERRRYYRLTGLGQRILRADAERQLEAVRLARRKGVLEGL